MPARFDTLPGLAPAKRTPAGFVRVQGFATRVGVFSYRQANGTVRRELRPPEEVFRADSLDALSAVPLTLNHPDGMLTPKNARALMVGLVSNAQVHGDNVRVDINITDEAAIAAAEAGIRQLSVGYEVDLDESPGVWRGQRYDAIQRNIVPNHLALVSHGRAGPEAKIRLDQLDGSAEACDETHAVDAPTQAEVKTMKIRFDDKDHEVSDEVFSHLEKLSARLDTALEEVKDLKAKADPSVIRAAAAERAKLLAAAASVFGAVDAGRFDAVDNPADIRKAVVEKLRPSMKLEGRSDAYVEGLFDLAMTSRADAVDSRKALTTATTVATATNVAAAAETSPLAEAQKRREDRALEGKG